MNYYNPRKGSRAPPRENTLLPRLERALQSPRRDTATPARGYAPEGGAGGRRNPDARPAVRNGRVRSAKVPAGSLHAAAYSAALHSALAVLEPTIRRVRPLEKWWKLCYTESSAGAGFLRLRLQVCSFTWGLQERGVLPSSLPVDFLCPFWRSFRLNIENRNDRVSVEHSHGHKKSCNKADP